MPKEETICKRPLVCGLVAHVDAGKTTLSEALLYRGGALRKLGRVDHQDAFLDTDAMERERGITIFSKQALLTLGETEITLLDTPGHVDFSYICGIARLWRFVTLEGLGKCEYALPPRAPDKSLPFS